MNCPCFPVEQRFSGSGSGLNFHQQPPDYHDETKLPWALITNTFGVQGWLVPAKSIEDFN
jgi:hypothetical protein